ncbi:pancreatic triacylglycerol lipase [Pieris rapae]|uniref:pancreatic triacylglycerol lipase n=1 Tax=Pieris rapae TaxID=64459 RepID=UPI001E27D2C0|nr:pancreatic triacylglycerol lipase [Pieris rapae]
MTNAYMGLKENTNINYVLLNWENEATTKYLGPVIHYPVTAIPNAKRIGEDLGDALLELSNHGLDLERVHLIGHSLGSHLVGHAGRQTIKKNKSVGRITGLDPAGPLYDGPTLLHPLRETDASFVVGIHSDPVVYGTSQNVGHVDIWLNCGMKHQPGCRENFLELCSHARAIYYYAESINSKEAFPAVESKSCRDWKAKKSIDDEDDIIYMGDNIDRNTTGIFYLRTNSDRPFGKGLDGIQYS